MILADTNILLRLTQPQAPEYRSVEAALRRLRREQISLCYASQNLIEFWNVLTRPKEKNGFGLTIEEADRETRLIEARLERLADNNEIHELWRHLVVQYRVSGRQVHDARLVAAMRAHRISQLLTFNSVDFERYASIINVIHPEHFAQEAGL